MERQQIPDTISVSNVFYGMNAYVLSCLLIGSGLLFATKTLKEKVFGFIILVPVLVAQTYSQMKPEYFYYIWDGWYGSLKLIGAVIYIIACSMIFHLYVDQTMDVIPFILLIVSIIYMIPNIVIPMSMDYVDVAWETIFHEKPNYMLADIVLPSALILSCLIGIGYMIQIVQ